MRNFLDNLTMLGPNDKVTDLPEIIADKILTLMYDLKDSNGLRIHVNKPTMIQACDNVIEKLKV